MNKLNDDDFNFLYWCLGFVIGSWSERHPGEPETRAQVESRVLEIKAKLEQMQSGSRKESA